MMTHPEDIENPYRCRTCNDAGTIDVWIAADVKAMRADPNTPKEKMHHPTLMACNRCKRGRDRVTKGMGMFDGRIQCRVTSHDIDADHSSEGELQRLAAFASTAQEWAPVESYEDVTGRDGE
jgi:hypothetical protein